MTQLERFKPGADISIDLIVEISAGVNIDIDNLVELYVYIVDSAGTTVARFSKAGVVVDDHEFTALIRTNAELYYFIIDSSITKHFQPQTFYMEINMFETNADLIDNTYNSIEKVKLFVIDEDANIKELS